MSTIFRAVSGGATTIYSVPFPYLDRSHVKVRKGAVLQIEGSDYTWLTSSSIQLVASAASGVVVTIQRQTPVTPLTVFTPGNLDTDDLNAAVMQPLYVAEEGRDLAGLAWVADPGDASAGTIQKGPEDYVPAYNSLGNLISRVSVAAIVAAAALVATINFYIPAPAPQHKNKQIRVNTAGNGFDLRRNPFYDPYEYGATGLGGVTDDTPNFVAMQMAAGANEGIQASPSGRGQMVVPPGGFNITHLTTMYPLERWFGMGGALKGTDPAQTVFEVAHGQVSVQGLQINSQIVPTARQACFKHSGGSDCSFKDIVTNGGWYGYWGQGGVDSYWENIIANAPYADSAYFESYQGLWLNRAKLDGAWPTSVQPTDANMRGALANSTLYVANDVVTFNGYYFQCMVGGTTPSSGSSLAITALYTNIVLGATTWQLARRTNTAAMNINSSCFIFKIDNSDISGGHDHGVWLHNTTGGGTNPQDIRMSNVETGGQLYHGVYAEKADGLIITKALAHVSCLSSGHGILLDTTRGASVTDSRIRGCARGIGLTANSKSTHVEGNYMYSCTTAIEVAAGTKEFWIERNDCQGDATLWGLNTSGIVLGVGVDEGWVRGNRVKNCTALKLHYTTLGTNMRLKDNT